MVRLFDGDQQALVEVDSFDELEKTCVDMTCGLVASSHDIVLLISLGSQGRRIITSDNFHKLVMCSKDPVVGIHAVDRTMVPADASADADDRSTLAYPSAASAVSGQRKTSRPETNLTRDGEADVDAMTSVSRRSPPPATMNSSALEKRSNYGDVEDQHTYAMFSPKSSLLADLQRRRLLGLSSERQACDL